MKTAVDTLAGLGSKKAVTEESYASTTKSVIGTVKGDKRGLDAELEERRCDLLNLVLSNSTIFCLTQ